MNAVSNIIYLIVGQGDAQITQYQTLARMLFVVASRDEHEHCAAADNDVLFGYTVGIPERQLAFHCHCSLFQPLQQLTSLYLFVSTTYATYLVTRHWQI